MTLVSYGVALRGHAEQAPERVAIRCEGDTAEAAEIETYAGLDRRANRLARVYAGLGVVAGDLVTVALPNGIEHFAACLAIWRLGATPQPVSARLPAAERRAIIELADPPLVVGAPPEETEGRTALPEGFVPDPTLDDGPLPDVVSESVRAMTSGGSTGRPKLIIERAPAQCDPDDPAYGMRPGGVTLTPGPLYHAGPFITAWNTLLWGGTVVLLRRFDPEACLVAIDGQRVEWTLFVPTMMQRIWKLPAEVRNRYDLSSLQVVMSAGAPSPPWLKRAWIEWLGPEKIFEAYGGTERIAGTQITGTEWLEHPGSVGRPSAGARVRILDEEGKECPPGQVGEVFMMPAAGQGSTYRYVGAEARATDDGWESLGDLGWLDEDGYLYLADRKTDMILSGGANVYPAEIEAALDAHSAVRSSAVIGLPDEDLGQRVHAIVDATAPVDDDSLRVHLAEHLARYKIPRSFEYVFEPLRDDAGKVRRSALRAARLDPGAR